MRIEVKRELLAMVSEYFHYEPLQAMLEQFIQDKAAEGSKWSEFTLYTHFMFEGRDPHIDRLAAITEMIILALDIIDDLQDQDNTSKPWMTCPQELAWNAAVALLAASMGWIETYCSKQHNHPFGPAETIGKFLAQAFGGQQRDLANDIRTEEDYVSMVLAKSGALMQLACYLGYCNIDTLTEQDIEQINQFASHVGMIAQLENDLNDILRFDIKNDLLQKKKTLPVLFLLRDCEQEFPVLFKHYENLISPEQFLDHKQACIQYIYDSGCIEYTRVIQSLFAEAASDHFAKLPAVSPWKEGLREITMDFYC